MSISKQAAYSAYNQNAILFHAEVLKECVGVNGVKLPSKKQLLKLKLFYEDLHKDVKSRINLAGRTYSLFRDKFKVVVFSGAACPQVPLEIGFLQRGVLLQLREFVPYT